MGFVGLIVGFVLAGLIYRNFPSVPNLFCSFDLCGTLGLIIFAIILAAILGKIIHV